MVEECKICTICTWLGNENFTNIYLCVGYMLRTIGGYKSIGYKCWYWIYLLPKIGGYKSVGYLNWYWIHSANN